MSLAQIDIKQKQENTLSKDIFNPFPGLRPFSIDDNYLFFGREGQSAEVIRNLTKYRFAAVTGASGEGKSSLVYCGVISGLHGGFIKEAGPNWEIVHFRPGSSPISNMADAIFKAFNKKANDYKNTAKPLILSLLKRSTLGLIEVVKQIKLKKEQNLLLIVDQFEELFRFREVTRNFDIINETETFIKLITEAVSQTELPIYVIITMRSDFLGECSQFPDLAKRINESNYLIPRMSREDYRKVITGPVSVAGYKIEEQLIYELLNNVTDEIDSLSIIQHALMRTYQHWMRYGNVSSPISYVDYETVGRIDRAISIHADEAYNELSDEGKRICRSLFTTLTERGEDNRGIRHPAKVSLIAEVAQASIKDTIEVIDKFRMEGRAFLTPSIETQIAPNTVIDISHESIMRNWDKLKLWIDEEQESVRMYLRLSEAAELYQLGKSGLWRPPDLLLAQNWRQKYKPNLAWAKRYNPAFERTMVFLETSEKKYESEERTKIRLQKRTLIRTRRFAAVLGAASIVFLGLVFYANVQRLDATKQREIAEEAKLEAEKQRGIAQENALKAQELQLIAESLAEEETEKRMIADAISEQSVAEKELALQNADVIKLESEQAVAQAEMQVDEVSQTLEKTKEEVTEAEKQKEREYRQRMLSIANTLAIKSRQINQNQNLKVLLAYQAYKINNEFGGREYNTDIYYGMLNALKAAQDESYVGFKEHEAAVRAIKFNPKSANVFYSTGMDGKIVRWDISNPKSRSVIFSNNLLFRDAAVSNNGRWLAVGAVSSEIYLFDLNNIDDAPRILTGHTGQVSSLAFAPNNQILFSTGADRSIISWDLSTFKSKIIVEHDLRILSICTRPTNSSYVIGSTEDGKIILWSLSDGAPSIIYEQPGNAISTLTFNKNGRYLAFGDKSGDVKLINPFSGVVIRTFKGHKTQVEDVDFSPNGMYIASSSRDGTIRLWNLENSNDPAIVLTGHESWIHSVEFSPDSKYLVSSSRKGDNVLVWPTSISVMAESMCKHIERNFSQSEWNTYVGDDIPYEKTCN